VKYNFSSYVLYYCCLRLIIFARKQPYISPCFTNIGDCLTEKIVRVDEELWKKAKILAAKRGITLKSLIERLLEMEIEAEKVMEEDKPAEEEIRYLEEKRRKGEIPFMIISRKTAVELVKEGRGD